MVECMVEKHKWDWPKEQQKRKEKRCITHVRRWDPKMVTWAKREGPTPFPHTIKGYEEEKESNKKQRGRGPYVEAQKLRANMLT